VVVVVVLVVSVLPPPQAVKARQLNKAVKKIGVGMRPGSNAGVLKWFITCTFRSESELARLCMRLAYRLEAAKAMFIKTYLVYARQLFVASLGLGLLFAT